MAYATVEELQALLRITAPTPLQTDAMQRALDEAAAEIDWDLNYTPTLPAPTPPPPLVVAVNLDRAVEHWQRSYSPFGLVGIGAETEPVQVRANSWLPHHLKLTPLRTQFGVA